MRCQDRLGLRLPQAPGSAAAGSSLHSGLATSSGQRASTPSSVQFFEGQGVAGSGPPCAGVGLGRRESEMAAAGGRGAAAEPPAGSGSGPCVDGSIAGSMGELPKRYDFQIMFDAIVDGDFEEPEKVAPE